MVFHWIVQPVLRGTVGCDVQWNLGQHFNVGGIPLDSPTCPITTWYSGVGQTVGSREALEYGWYSIGQSNLSYVVQWGRTDSGI